MAAVGEGDEALALARIDEEGELQRLQRLAGGEHAIDERSRREALDHDAAHLADGLADQRDAVRAPFGQIGSGQRLRTHPFGARARLAGAAAAEQEPGVPGLAAGGEDGRQLIMARRQQPIEDDAVPLLAIDRGGNPLGAVRQAG